MPVDDIRARIAEYEIEMERRREAEVARRMSAASAAATEDDPWQHLFNTPWIEPDDSAKAVRNGAEFSLSAWLTDGLRGLRSWLPATAPGTEFWQHLHGAERELLLAVRVLVDNRLTLMEARNKPVMDADRLQEIEIEF